MWRSNRLPSRARVAARGGRAGALLAAWPDRTSRHPRRHAPQPLYRGYRPRHRCQLTGTPAGATAAGCERCSRQPAQWWSLLDSPRLDATIRAALDGNRDLAAARATSGAGAGAGRRQRRRRRYPQLDLDASAGAAEVRRGVPRPREAAAVHASTRSGPASAMRSILPAACGARSSSSARSPSRSSTSSRRRRWRSAATWRCRRWRRPRRARRSSTVEALLDDDGRTSSWCRTAFDAGGATRVDMLNAQSQLANDQTLLPPLRRQLQHRPQHALALLVGQRAGELERHRTSGSRNFSCPRAAADAALRAGAPPAGHPWPPRRSCMPRPRRSASPARISIRRSA